MLAESLVAQVVQLLADGRVSQRRVAWLTLQRYESMKGFGGSIDTALGEAMRQTGAVGTPDNLRRLVVPGLATWDPAAYFIPYANPATRYLGIENNYLEISQNNILASEVKRLMRTPGRAKFVVSVGDLDVEKLNKLLANFDLRLSAAPCRPIHSNLEDQALSLCGAE